MKITNKHNLPQALVNAVENDSYVGGGDISVTRLINPPQITYLAKGIDLEEDVTDRIWSLLGQSIHTILQRAYEHDPQALVERRLYTTCGGLNVSGQLDVLEEGVLSDYKVTSVYARDGKLAWEQQLNLLALLCRDNGIAVKRIQVVAIFRDWRPKEALKDDYPQSQVAVIPVALWEPEIAAQFMLERVKAHQRIPPALCTDEERWLSPAKWALMKRGQKRAIKLFELKPQVTLLPGQYLEHRPGAYRRCESYCPVSHVCPQWMKDYEAATRNQDGAAEPQALADAS